MVKQTVINRLRQKFTIKRKPPPPPPNKNLSKSVYNKLKPLLNLELFKYENNYNRLFTLYSNMKKTKHLEKPFQAIMPQLALAC